jgi:3-keto-disaccharide hydrolase
MRRSVNTFCMFALCTSAALAADGAPGAWRPLLDAKLSQFDVYLSFPGTEISDVLSNFSAPVMHKPIGLNPPGQNVFSVIQQDGKPVLRITGEIYGCLQTREAFSNYHLRLETRWGEKKWVPRLDEPKDSGILYHSQGPFGVDYWKSWALSHEFQIIEHGLGEYWAQATGAIDVQVAPKESRDAIPRWSPAGKWEQFGGGSGFANHVLAATDEDRAGQWNRLELVCYQDDCVHIVNGKVVMALANARHREALKWVPMTGGKLQIQSEAAEVFFRNMEIRSIPAMPAEYRRYFEGSGD